MGPAQKRPASAVSTVTAPASKKKAGKQKTAAKQHGVTGNQHFTSAKLPASAQGRLPSLPATPYCTSIGQASPPTSRVPTTRKRRLREEDDNLLSKDYRQVSQDTWASDAVSRATAAEARARAAEERARDADLRYWKQRAEEHSEMLNEQLRNVSSVIERASTAEQRAAHAEGVASALKADAGRAAEAEQRAIEAEVRAARAEGRTEVLREMHGSLPHMIRAVASALKQGVDSLDSVQIKVEPAAPKELRDARAGTPHACSQSSADGGDGGGRDPSELLEEMQARRGSATLSLDPVDVLEDMQRRRTLR